MNPVFWRVFLYPLFTRIFIVLERIAGDYAFRVAIRLPMCDFWFRPFFINEWHMALGIWDKVYEPYLRNALRLSEGDVFVDVGAYIGHYDQHVARTVGDSGTVVCIEANPFNAQILARNMAAFPQARTLWAAASDSNAPVPLALTDRPAYSISHELTGIEDGEFKAIIAVPGITIDGLMRELSIRNRARVFLKIEVGGSRLHVIRGGREFIERYLPTIILGWEEDLDEVKNALPNYQFNHLFMHTYVAVPRSRQV